MNIFKAISIFIKILKDKQVICNVDFSGDIRISACDPKKNVPHFVNSRFWEHAEQYYLYSSEHNRIPVLVKNWGTKKKIQSHPFGDSDHGVNGQKKPNPNIKPPTPRLVQEGYDPKSI